VQEGQFGVKVLYAYPVLFDVYPLRRDGLKLPVEEVRANGRRGQLRLAPREDGAPVAIARLISARGSVIGELNCARVSVVTDAGLMVVGWERIGVRRQAWWCVPVSA